MLKNIPIFIIFSVHFNGLLLLDGECNSPADVNTVESIVIISTLNGALRQYQIISLCPQIISSRNTPYKNLIPRYNYINSTDYHKLKLQL